MTTISLRTLPGAVLDEGAHGLVVDWDAVDRQLEKLQVNDPDETYSSLAFEWLASLAHAWNADFTVYQSSHFLIVTSLGAETAGKFAQLGERVYQWMTSELPEIAEKCGFGRFVCIIADNGDRYYDYVSGFYPDGEYGASGGVFLTATGYAHFVINQAETSQQELTLVHELTHALLVKRELPLWLEEGLTQRMEDEALGGHGLYMNREEAERHRDFWLENSLSGFWYGSSFSRPDDGMELSYALSQVIVHNLLSRNRSQFLEFVKQAHRFDCGENASQSVYGVSLAEWAAEFLGPGDWGVTPTTAFDFFARAASWLEQGCPEKAKQDYLAAANAAPNEPDCLNEVSWILATHPDPGVRDGEAAVRLATKSCELTDWVSEPNLDTLAAAYAENGEFERAIETQQAALERAPAEVRAEEEARLSLYREGKAFRDPAWVRAPE